MGNDYNAAGASLRALRRAGHDSPMKKKASNAIKFMREPLTQESSV